MNNYFQQFRNSPFSGSFSLYGRVLVPSLILNIIIAIVSVVVILPITAKALGINVFEMDNLGKEFAQNMKEIQSSGGNPQDFLKSYFTQINVLFVLLASIVGLIVTSWQYFLFFKLNDNEVRSSNNSFANALKASFSSKILTIALFLIIYLVIFIVGFILWGVLTGVLMASIGGFGGFIAFLLILVLFAVLLRFLIAPAAIVHGNMAIGDAIAFSWKNINMRRAFTLLLIGFVFFIVAIILLAIISGIVGLVGIKSLNNETEMSTMSIVLFVVGQIISGVLGAIVSAYLYSSISALYFRFSNEETESENTIQEHLINE